MFHTSSSCVILVQYPSEFSTVGLRNLAWQQHQEFDCIRKRDHADFLGCSYINVGDISATEFLAGYQSSKRFSCIISVFSAYCAHQIDRIDIQFLGDTNSAAQDFVLVTLWPPIQFQIKLHNHLIHSSYFKQLDPS